MYFSNESKYRCCKPSCNLSNHVAYFETLPDSFKDFSGTKGINSKFTTHCCREFFHEQWKTLLDDQFLEAYEHRIVIICCNSIPCRFYPRIFTYSADYPENAPIECILKPQSWVPTSIRFVDRDMLMRFHFGLGVGHAYSHHRLTQPELHPEGSAAHAAFTHDVEDPGEMDGVGGEEDSEDDNEDDSTESGSDIERRFGSSDESLLDQFNEMYNSNVSLDYEN
ncbi:hypothetical protein BDR05DRAFT_947857 [Suillus weaverae]|nr:hypothetical protein BDR05DRAFT_947857 [Suillus weaverae]